MPLRHRISFTIVAQRFELIDEAIENEHIELEWQEDVRFYYRYQKGSPVLNVSSEQQGGAIAGKGPEPRKLRREDLEPNQSVLAQRKDPDLYPEITYLGNNYSKIGLYREWNFGRYTPPRLSQKADLPDDFLLEDASNLGLVLNDLQHSTGLKKEIISKLKQFHPSFNDFSIKVHAGTTQLFLHEDGLQAPIPATRLSDGTLRYLCLIAILCHPTPPPLICIEEPELGLHPDIMPVVADMLIDASHRTQLIITTHSEVLVDALTSTPDVILICEKENGSTRMRRLDTESLKNWLEKYSLGELWRKGELGGNRW
jgi:predicted ATPase